MKRVAPDSKVRGYAKKRKQRRQEQGGEQSRQTRTRARNGTPKLGEEKNATVSEVRREGDEGTAWTGPPGNARRRRIMGPMPRTGTSGASQEQATKHHGPLDWSIQGAEETARQKQGARAGTSGDP